MAAKIGNLRDAVLVLIGSKQTLSRRNNGNSGIFLLFQLFLREEKICVNYSRKQPQNRLRVAFGEAGGAQGHSAEDYD